MTCKGGAHVPVNDTWLFEPRTTTWTKVTTATQPPAYGEVAMGWSPSTSAVVMTGGSDVIGMTLAAPGTWAFDMSRRDWVKLTDVGGPPSARKDASLTADLCRGSAIVFGGEDGPIPPAFGDRTWILR